MIVGRLEAWSERMKSELRLSFAEAHSSKETAGSFALGVFITMLPTLGTGLIVFVILSWLFDRINRVALFASVVVFNPVVKWGVYAASFTLGVFILGPVPDASATDVSLSAGPEIVTRLIVGNVILAIIAAVPGYFVCYRLVEAYKRRGVDIVETIEDVILPEEDVSRSEIHVDSDDDPSMNVDANEDTNDEIASETRSDGRWTNDGGIKPRSDKPRRDTGRREKRGPDDANCRN